MRRPATVQVQVSPISKALLKANRTSPASARTATSEEGVGENATTLNTSCSQPGNGSLRSTLSTSSFIGHGWSAISAEAATVSTRMNKKNPRRRAAYPNNLRYLYIYGPSRPRPRNRNRSFDRLIRILIADYEADDENHRLLLCLDTVKPLTGWDVVVGSVYNSAVASDRS